MGRFDNKIYFLKAGTGAGKSTLFINALWGISGGKSIICTKPRIALVTEAMKDLPKHYPTFIKGITLGYKIGGEGVIPKGS